MQYVTINRLNQIIRKHIHEIPRNIDLVVGIPRSGMLAANIIALNLNLRLTDFESFLDGRIYQCGNRGQYVKRDIIKNVLIVDDSIRSGGSLKEAKKRLSLLQANQYNFTFCVPIADSKCLSMIDIYFEVIDDQRIFEWNLFNHVFLSRSCMDIDGVLCKDPDIDDDGPIYSQFLDNATPLYIPTSPVDVLISCRLEKYRVQTEQWLKKYDIKYKRLVLLDMQTKAERVKWGKHGEYKASFYRDSSNILFIESSYRQAKIIAKLSKKPVICIETNTLIVCPTIPSRIYNIIERWLPRLSPKLKEMYHNVIKK